MTANDIRALLEAEPFVKLYLNLSDGAGYEVSDPTQVAFNESGGVLVHETRGRRAFIAVAQVVSIGFPPPVGDPFFLRSRS